ncbi:MAG: ATP-binding protein [Planctomycetota bacterium]|nr:ATP-binding protein [Planctomycetota bacterium]
MNHTGVFRLLRCIGRPAPPLPCVADELARPAAALAGAQRIHERLPGWLARRAMAPGRIPLFAETGSAHLLSGQYQISFQQAADAPRPERDEDLDAFRTTLHAILGRHARTNSQVAMGLAEVAADHGSAAAADHRGLQRGLGAFFQDHAALRVVLGRCLGGDRLIEPECLASLARSAVSEARRLPGARDKSVRVLVAGDVSPTPRRCLRDHVRFAIYEMVKNAAQAARREVRVLVASDGLSVRVDDDGPGMDDRALARAFAWTYTTAATAPAEAPRQLPPDEGLGFGVPASRVAMRVAGGDLELRSCPGHGTSAFVRLAPAA